jgi:hypothetical protein
MSTKPPHKQYEKAVEALSLIASIALGGRRDNFIDRTSILPYKSHSEIIYFTA